MLLIKSEKKDRGIIWMIKHQAIRAMSVLIVEK